MNARQNRIFRYLLVLIGAVTIACIIIHIVFVSRYNSTLHTVKGYDESEQTTMNIRFRGGDTSSWLKRDMGLTGKIYDATLQNHSSNTISNWQLLINISGDCYLNQFWNGESEIHQHVASGKEKTQTLNLASYDVDSIILDYVIDETDLLIPLEKGDYIVYHPAASVGEIPLMGGTDLVVGFILYFDKEVDLSDYTLDYYYQLGFMQGPMFVFIFVLIFLWILALGVKIASDKAYKKAQKEMQLRRSGIACMAELYASIYIIDLKKNTIEVVSSQIADDIRPKDLTANEQMKNLAMTEMAPLYKTLIAQFVDLDTLPERLKDRNSLAVECVSIHHGWSRLRFIVMDRKEGHPPDKVLFTIQQINEEKKELDAIRNQIEKEQEENKVRQDYLDSIYQDAITPVRSILNLGNLILRSTENEETLGYASEIKTISESFLTLASNTLDVSALDAGRMKVAIAPYSLRDMIAESEKIVQISMEDKAIELKTDIGRAIPETLIGDGLKLKRVVSSLLTRMIGAMESGEIQLQVFGKSVNEKKVHLLISVRGSGLIQDVAEAERGMRLIEGILSLMNSELKTVQMGQDRDYYFELDQEIPDTDVPKEGHGEEAKH